MQHRVEGDLILPQSFHSHSRERQQAAGDLSRETVHGSLHMMKEKKKLL